MNIQQLINLPEFIPHKRIPLRMEQLRPIYDRIAEEIWVLSLPKNGLDEEMRRAALIWADGFRSNVPDCCASHSVDAMRKLLNEIAKVLEHCTSTECDKHNRHDFLETIGLIIDGQLSSFFKRIAMNAEVRERVN